MPTIQRPVVKALHHDINTALADVAKKHGFTYLPAGLRFTDIDIKGQVTFVIDGKEQELVQSKTGHLAIGDLKIGDKVTILNDRHSDTYVIEKFTPHGGSHIARERDNKKFRCRQDSLVKVGDKAPAALKDAMECPECKDKKYICVGSRRVGPEVAEITYKCMGCGYTDTDVAD